MPPAIGNSHGFNSRDGVSSAPGVPLPKIDAWTIPRPADARHWWGVTPLCPDHHAPFTPPAMERRGFSGDELPLLAGRYRNPFGHKPAAVFPVTPRSCWEMGARRSCRSCLQGACVSLRCSGISLVVAWEGEATALGHGDTIGAFSTAPHRAAAPSTETSPVPLCPSLGPALGGWLGCNPSFCPNPTWCSSD